MLKNRKLKIIVSSLIILLPVLFGFIMWDKLPNNMTVHWGGDGVADGQSSKLVAILILPLILLAVHLLCILGTLLDKRNTNYQSKAFGIIFWIVPVIALFANGIMYSTALGGDMSVANFIPALIGILFMYIGNYLPKIRQNSIMGIKTHLTLANEENWNKTHRFGGKVWFFGGLVILFSVFLPVKVMATFLTLVFVVMTAIPFVYSYKIYTEHKKQGIIYDKIQDKWFKTGGKITAVILPLILVVIVAIMFTGNITVQYGDNFFKIEADYFDDLAVEYKEIESIEYREENVKGARTFGFGSPRLSLGNFQNEEFGTYTLYSYTKAESFVVIKSGEKVLVIGGKTEQETKAIYEKLIERTK